MYRIFKANASGFKFRRTCCACNASFEVAVWIGDEARVSCLECEACHSLAWLNHETDPIWRDNPQEKSSGVKNQIESLIPPCDKCGGKLVFIPWFDYGAPVHCPKCGADQRDPKNQIDPNLSQVQEVREERTWLKHVDALQ